MYKLLSHHSVGFEVKDKDTMDSVSGEDPFLSYGALHVIHTQ